MIKKYSLVFIALLCSFFYGFGQIKIAELTFETAGGYTTSVAENTDNNYNYFTRTNGTNVGGNVSFLNIQNSFYFAVQDTDDIVGNNTVSLNISNINISGYTNLELRIHLAEDDDGSNQDWDGDSYVHVTGTIDSGTAQNLIWVEAASGTNTEPRLDTNFDGTGNGTAITDSFSQFTNPITGTGANLDVQIEFNDLNAGDEDIAIDNIEIWGTPSCTDTADFNNLQSPANGTITVGNAFNVYAQVYELGVTPGSGQGANIEAWIGYSTSDTDPSGAGWTWFLANYNAAVTGNNDEYSLDLGSQILAPGTYYYASRFRYNNCGFTYGGYDTGFGDGDWDGTDDVNGVLNVIPDQVDFCNVEYPKAAEIIVGGNHTVYAQAYEPGVTDAAGQGADIEAWIGYNTIGINHQPWNSTGWTWVPATYNPSCLDCNGVQNDEYYAEIGSGLSSGTYYYASRFRLNSSEFSYGGIASDNVGNFWDNANNNGTLSVYNPPNNATNFEGCFSDTSVDLTWSAPGSGTTPDGYIVFAIEGATAPTGAKGDASSYTAISDFSAASIEIPASLGKVVYKGTGNSATITGLTEDTNYSFAVFAYKLENETGWSSGSVASRILDGIAQDDIRNLTAIPDNNQMTLNWSNPTPTSCWDELIIVANIGTVTFIPTSGISYFPDTDNGVYNISNEVVYSTQSNVTTKSITNLINGTNYCFKIFVKTGSNWSDGIEICETPIITYCDATSNSDSYNTGVTGVVFNTISNIGTSANNTYVDYTTLSTNVEIGTSYDLSVNVNVDGNGTVYSRVWIDWNIDGDFNDSNEEYNLGTLYNPSNSVDLDGATSQSPLSIEIPTTAVAGTTRMRVAAKWNSYPTSCEDNYSGEIEDYTLVIDQPTDAEINIKGNNITIPNGFNAPYGLNNTLYGETDITTPIASMPIKSFFISNLGLTVLNFTNSPRVEIIGDHPGDFTVIQQPAASIAPGNPDEEFIVRFNPTTSGVRKAKVRVYNNDSTGSENPYIFDIQGTGSCSTPITTNMWPDEGPEDTEITITSATSLVGATAKINDIIMPVVSDSVSELVVTLPNGATDGNIVILFSTGCTSTQTFDVIDKIIDSCEGSSGATTPTDLFISEVTDATSGSSTLIEIYNGTNSAKNLSEYSIKIYNNGSSSASSSSVLSGTLAAGGIYVVSVGTTSCSYNNIGAGIDLSFNGVAGINFDTNKSDAIVLEKTSGTSQGEKDMFGEKGSGTWANGLSFGSDGVNFRRFNTAIPLPSLTFSLGDWDIIDWTNCSNSNYVNIGVYDFSLGNPPNITTHPDASITNCDASINLTVAADEGYNGGAHDLEYHWFYLAPNSPTWTEITSDGGPYEDYNQATLKISFSDIIDVNGYQYYCQIRESLLTCYTASKAVKINHERSFWNGTSWSSPPVTSKLAVINGDYNTSGGGTEVSFEACNLVVNSSATLAIANNTFVRAVNNTQNKGILNIQTQGSFVQVGNGAAAGTFTNSGGGIANVAKTTAQFDSTVSEINYTYWSSPVNNPSNSGFGQDISTVFPTPVGNRRYYFMAQEYIDSFIETDNNNDDSTNPGQDDIDDNFNDWRDASGAMEIGRGYAVTTSGLPPSPGNYTDNSTVFSGALNTGDITVILYKNNNEVEDNNWNFIGNPYPSAISVNDFFSANASVSDVDIDPLENVEGLIEGAIFLWSQSQAPNPTNNGNENINFAQSDYSIINRVAETAGNSENTKPNRFIPSGQGFFVAFTENLSLPVNSLTTGNVVFTNSMRRTGNNDQFFEANNSTQEDDINQTYEHNILWLNLTSDNGVFSQIAVAYADGATDNYDGWSYDTPRNLSTGTYASLYSIINSSDRQFAIQGKHPESLALNESISLGFETSIDEATLYKFSISQLEGGFMNQNDIFIKDNLLNITHNLKESDYNFTSEVGEFNDRFEIVFSNEALSVNDNVIDKNTLQIIELANGDVQFQVSSQYEMKSIEIIDLLGRTVYKLDVQGNSQIFSLGNLSQSTYLAKVKLTNGHVITKKALKRR